MPFEHIKFTVVFGTRSARRCKSLNGERAESSWTTPVMPPKPDVRLQEMATQVFATAMLKGFGCREAYESLSCRNPRATVDGYGDFSLRLMSATAWPPPLGDAVDTDGPLSEAPAQPCSLCAQADGALRASLSTMGARGSVAAG